MACAFLLGLSGLSALRASDVGIDIPAAAYDFESEPDDEFIIRDMGSKVGYIMESDTGYAYWGHDDFDLSGNRCRSCDSSSRTIIETESVFMESSQTMIGELGSLFALPFPAIGDHCIDHQLADVIHQHRYDADTAIDRDLQSHHQRFLAAADTDRDLAVA